MDVWLNPVLAPTGTYDLIRLGRDGDGGYLVDPRSVIGAERLISFGMNDDWSFEEAFRAMNRVPVDVYDHTVSADIFFRQAYHYLLRLDRPGLFFDRFRVWRAYRRAFRGEMQHHKTGIGYRHLRMLDLDIVVERLGAAEARLFLSVDIEGWEYRILDQLLAHAGKLEGLAIEFHDCDLLMPRIEAFVAALPLNLCHVAANNTAGADPAGTPLALELSFTRHDPQGAGRPALPHALDQPNNPAMEPLTIRFTDAEDGRA
ncbi:MAG: hypothetical protein QNJ16_16080 [Rhodobacter sp.]|nr:hypothetical protein [Rhodobacter sp.]